MVWSWQGGDIDTILTFHLEPHANGTRFRITHSGFEGFKGVLTSFILGAGSRKIYGKFLPGVLDQLATARDGHEFAGDTGCEEGGLWRVLAAAFSPILGRQTTELI